MLVECPQCLSSRTKERHLGKQIGAALGALVGAVSGAASAACGIHIDRSTVLPVRPAHAPTIVAGAITGGFAGSAMGAALGELIDVEFLDTHLCLLCGNTFRTTRSERPFWDYR
jgi:hypothetical protein